MGKITVKHYLNTRVSPLVLGSEGNEKDYYPIYTQITHDRRTTQIRSFTNYYFTVAGIEDYIKTGKFDDDDFFSVSKFDNKALADEITQIEKSIYFITYNKIDITKTGYKLRYVLEILFTELHSVLTDHFRYWSAGGHCEDQTDLGLFEALNPNRTLTHNIRTIKKYTEFDISKFIPEIDLYLSSDIDLLLKNAGTQIRYIEFVSMDYHKLVDNIKGFKDRKELSNFLDYSLSEYVAILMPIRE